MSVREQQLLDALPATGEARWIDVRAQLLTEGKEGAVSMIHVMRRAGTIKARNEKGEDGRLVLFVSRP